MRRQRKQNLILILILVLAFTGIGYAILTSTLSINGTTDVDSNTWNVYWDNVQVTTGSVTGSQVITAPTIDSNKTKVSFHIRLKEPGEYYEFTVDAKNTGSIDAMINSITKTANGSTTLPAYLNYTVTYSDGVALEQYHMLNAGVTEVIKVRVEYRTDITTSQLPSSDQSISIKFQCDYIQKNSNAVEVDHLPLFEVQPLSTVINNMKNGNVSDYHVGDSRRIEKTDGTTDTLIILNMSTPSECNQSGFSQTGCGLVLGLYSYSGRIRYCENSTDYIWNVASIRSYINNTTINKLPDVIKNNIIDTTVVSNNTGNQADVVTTDKLYLLDLSEIFGTGSEGISSTRQLDYYAMNNITLTSQNSLITGSDIFTRTVCGSLRVCNISNTGVQSTTYCFNESYYFPAFRIG